MEKLLLQENQMFLLSEIKNHGLLFLKEMVSTKIFYNKGQKSKRKEEKQVND